MKELKERDVLRIIIQEAQRRYSWSDRDLDGWLRQLDLVRMYRTPEEQAEVTLVNKYKKELEELKIEHSTCEAARTLHSERIQSTFAETDEQIRLLTEKVVSLETSAEIAKLHRQIGRLRQQGQELAAAMNAYIGCEAPLVTGKYWKELAPRLAEWDSVFRDTDQEKGMPGER